MVLTALGFGLCLHVAESVLLDADDGDISLSELVIRANEVSDPMPGDIFVYDHNMGKFIKSKYCSMQSFEKPGYEPGVFQALNAWGVAVNAALASARDFLPPKVQPLLHVEKANHGWEYEKTFRPKVQPDEGKASKPQLVKSCQSDVVKLVAASDMTPFIVDVVKLVAASDMTPFIVDVVYDVKTANGSTRWVGFANPIIFEPNSCDDCPIPKQLHEVIPANRFTRIKHDWEIVSVD